NTILVSDWSSDVCSSDLLLFFELLDQIHGISPSAAPVVGRPAALGRACFYDKVRALSRAGHRAGTSYFSRFCARCAAHRSGRREVGRASCRERVWRWGGG